eukprot:5150913-Pyramimonas_sp.AAC.1
MPCLGPLGTALGPSDSGIPLETSSGPYKPKLELDKGLLIINITRNGRTEIRYGRGGRKGGCRILSRRASTTWMRMISQRRSTLYRRMMLMMPVTDG